MDTNDLNAAAPTLSPESLKPRDDAFDEIVKEAFQEFTRRQYPPEFHHLNCGVEENRAQRLTASPLVEREFLMGLSKSDAKALVPIPGIDPKDLPLLITSQQRHYVEILLTLKGLKPCTVIFAPTSAHIFTRL